MPNHCYNKIRITGETDALMRMRDYLKSDESVFDLESIIPAPADIEDNEELIDWRWEHWGTKWNTYEVILDEDDESLEYTFYTAWSPPKPPIEVLREIFPKSYISAFYDEPLMEDAGYY